MKPTSRKPTRFIPSATGNPHSFNGARRIGTIVGTVIAGVVLVLSAAFFIGLRLKRKAQRQSLHQQKPDPAESKAEGRVELPTSPITPAMLSGSESDFPSPASWTYSNLTSTPTIFHEAPSSPAGQGVIAELDASSLPNSREKDHPLI
jgi:hypothetical protein